MQMARHYPTTVSHRDFPGHYWRGEWVSHKAIVTDGFTDWWIHGETAGADLYIFLGGFMIDLPGGVTDHAGAVAWCERQFARSEVTL
jgi:hypothetical protein